MVSERKEEEEVEVEVEKEGKKKPFFFHAFSPSFSLHFSSSLNRIVLTSGHVGRDELGGLLRVGEALFGWWSGGREKERERKREKELNVSVDGLRSRAQKKKTTPFSSTPKLTASTKPQLATGPQKCVVLRPVGESTNALRREAREAPPAREAAIGLKKEENEKERERKKKESEEERERENSRPRPKKEKGERLAHSPSFPARTAHAISVGLKEEEEVAK